MRPDFLYFLTAYRDADLITIGFGTDLALRWSSFPLQLLRVFALNAREEYGKIHVI